VPISSLGTGAGSCGFVQGEQVDLEPWAPLLRQVRHLGVRGPRSKAKLAAVGVEHAEVVGDLAMMLTREHAVPVDGATPIIAVNLSLPAAGEPSFGEADRFAELAEVLRWKIDQGWQIRPYAMNAVDLEPTRDLVHQLGLGGLNVPHLGSADAMFDYIGPATCNIAVRLHGAILGCCVGVPPLMLGYRDKCLDFAESMGLESWCISLPTARPGEVAERAEAMVTAAPAMRDAVLERALQLKRGLVSYADRIARKMT
jgi:polysaccharide pyruvyl transferase WcaK-like protein